MKLHTVEHAHILIKTGDLRIFSGSTCGHCRSGSGQFARARDRCAGGRKERRGRAAAGAGEGGGAVGARRPEEVRRRAPWPGGEATSAAATRARAGPGWAPRAAAAVGRRRTGVVPGFVAGAVGHVRRRRGPVRRREGSGARVRVEFIREFRGRGVYIGRGS